MANYNYGKKHSLGYVAGSFVEGLTGACGFIACIVFMFVVKNKDLISCLVFGAISFLAFSVYSFAMFVRYRNFGSGARSKIINSKNMSPLDNYSLYDITGIISKISLVVCAINALIAILLLLLAYPWR